MTHSSAHANRNAGSGPNDSRTNTYTPPERGNAAASSEYVSAPHSTTIAPTTQARRNSGTSSMRWATLAGVRKMPLPIVEPTSTATALHRPSRRINRSPQRSAGIKGADMETQYTRERNEDQRTRFGFDPRPKRARSGSAPLQGAPSSSPTNPRW